MDAERREGRWPHRKAGPRGYQDSYAPLARTAVPVTTRLQPRRAVFSYIAAFGVNVRFCSEEDPPWRAVSMMRSVEVKGPAGPVGHVSWFGTLAEPGSAPGRRARRLGMVFSCRAWLLQRPGPDESLALGCGQLADLVAFQPGEGLPEVAVEFLTGVPDH